MQLLLHLHLLSFSQCDLPALIFKTAPTTVGVTCPKTRVAVRELLTILHLHLAQLPVCHHVHVVTFQIKQKLRPKTSICTDN